MSSLYHEDNLLHDFVNIFDEFNRNHLIKISAIKMS